MQSIFCRKEIKYIVTEGQRKEILSAMDEYMEEDDFPHSTVRSVYYDTPSRLLIRRSLEKPRYKEKLRVRSYTTVGSSDSVFVEIKKKYDGIVYKRRVALPEKSVSLWLEGKCMPEQHSQIVSEIEYFRILYGNLAPAVFISAERDAYRDRDGEGFRLTFDRSIMARTEDISLSAEPGGTMLLPRGLSVMELKSSRGFPLWITGFLSRASIYPVSFSKYGTAYRTIMKEEQKGGMKSAI